MVAMPIIMTLEDGAAEVKSQAKPGLVVPAPDTPERPETPAEQGLGARLGDPVDGRHVDAVHPSCAN